MFVFTSARLFQSELQKNVISMCNLRAGLFLQNLRFLFFCLYSLYASTLWPNNRDALHICDVFCYAFKLALTCWPYWMDTDPLYCFWQLFQILSFDAYFRLNIVSICSFVIVKRTLFLLWIIILSQKYRNILISNTTRFPLATFINSSICSKYTVLQSLS